MGADEPRIVALGYVGVKARSLEDWERFGTGLLGLQAVKPSRGDLAFRMDEAAHRLMVSAAAEDGPDFFGWEVRDAAALSAIATRLENAGHRVERMSASLAAQRGVGDAIVTTDPCGNRLEIFHDLARVDTPFAPGRAVTGFRTDALGMGHAVLNVESVERTLPYYRDLLGFRLSDYALRPFKAYFLHANARHHSLAMIETGRTGLHHLMIEVAGFDDLGQGYDLALLEPGRVATSLGRHSNDHMTSFYVRSPSGFLIEYGWGGRDIDPAAWTPMEMHMGPSLWGHERDWLPDDVKAEARRMRLEAAAQGMRAPLNVPPQS
jgi:2,3-dihydroxybiphenyl 1,2-dioxygenase